MSIQLYFFLKDSQHPCLKNYDKAITSLNTFLKSIAQLKLTDESSILTIEEEWTRKMIFKVSKM